MATELRWIASLPASALCCGAALWDGKTLAVPGIAAELEAAATQLRTAISDCGLKPHRVLPHLIALAAGIPQVRELAEVALTKSLPRQYAQLQAPRVADAIREVVAACRSAVPELLDELTVRSGPLRNQWEARGPGVLAAMGRLVEPDILVDRAEVVLVYPVLGGGGTAYARYNTVTIEAVLTDPVARLPEVVRLAWLLSQLSCDRPDRQERISPSNQSQERWTSDRLECWPRWRWRPPRCRPRRR